MMKQLALKLTIGVCLACLSSCSLLLELMTGGEQLLANTVASTPSYRVELLECSGNRSSQSVTVTLIVTNYEANTTAWIGSFSNTYAIDDRGRTSKPYYSAGVSTNLPTNVPVRVAIERIEPVFNTNQLRHLEINIGNGKENCVVFRYVPIVWYD